MTHTTEKPATADDWSAPVRTDPDGESLQIDIAGFAGPLDLLLALARTQKVDLATISVVELADQYLQFVQEARRLRLALAADYLVMAAWLTFLKSRLLLPRTDETDAELSAEDMARRLAFRLMRLQAMRDAAAGLMTRNRLGRDVFSRGNFEPMETTRERIYKVDIYELLKAYANQRNRTVKRVHVVRARVVWSIKDARRRLEQLVGPLTSGSWVQLDLCLEQFLPSAAEGRTALAASFGASLEMAREGMLELRQDTHFSPIFMRHRAPEADTSEVADDARRDVPSQ